MKKNNYRILIVDDDLQQCITLKTILQEEGFKVSSAGSSKDALKKIRKSFYNIILLDLVLPDLSGLELLRLIRDISPQSLVVISTGYASRENAIEALNIGAFAYLVKPLNIPNLLEIIRRAIELQKLDQQKLKVEEGDWQSIKSYSTLMDRAVIGIFLIQDEKLVFVNKALSDGLGYSLDELVDRKFQELIFPQDRERVIARAKARLQGKSPSARTIFKVLKKDGMLMDIETFAFPTTYNGKPAILGTAIDITERLRRQKEQEEELSYQTLLSRFTSQLISATTQKKILNIAQQVIYEVGDELSFIALLNRNRQFLLIKRFGKYTESIDQLLKSISSKKSDLRNKRFKIPLRQRKNIFKEVIKRGTPLITSNIDTIDIEKGESLIKANFVEFWKSFIGHDRQLQRELAQKLKILPLKSAAIIPIIVNKKAVGVLTISSRSILTPKAFYLAENIAISLGVSLERLKLVEDLRHSERSYKDLFEKAADGIFIFNLKGKFLDGNRAAEEISGYKTEELIGKPFRHILSPKIIEPTIEDIDKLLKGQISHAHREIEIIRKNNQLVPLEIRTTLIKHRGRPVAIQSIVRDITERKEMEKALRQSEAKYRGLFEYMEDAIFVCDFQGRFIDVNQKACEMTRYAKEELLKMSIPDLHAKEDLRAFKKYFHRIITGEPIISQANILRKDGSEIPCEFNSSIIGPPQAKVFHSIARDISERKKAEQERHRSYQIQTILNKLLSISLEDIPIEEMLDRIIEQILSISWLVLESKGAIFLVEDDPEMLELKAKRGLSKSKIKLCCRIPFGECLCGKAASSGKIVFKDLVKIPRDDKCKKFTPHGHYCVPIISAKNKVLGVINLYLKLGYHRDEKEEEFLHAVASVLAGIIERKRAEEALRKSEERYRAIFENSQFGIYITTPDGKFKTVNQALARIDGYDSAKEMMAANLERDIYVYPEDMKRFRDELNQKGYIHNYEINYRRKDGKIITCLESAVAVKDKNGKVLEYHGTIADISERKRLMEELKKAEDKYRSIFENVPTSIFFLDPQGKILDVNSYHLENEDCNTRNKDFYLDKYIFKLETMKKAGVADKLVELLKGKSFYLREVYFPITWIGEAKYYNLRGTPLMINGNVIGAIVLLVDVTDMKKLQAELMQSEKLSALGEMISGVAHELNNPLTSVLGYSHLLQHSDIAQSYKEDLKKINSEANRCQKIVQNLLRFACRYKPERKYININEVLENTLELRAYELKVDNIRIMKELEPSLSRTMADSNQLQQVFFNLLNNAHQAMVSYRGSGNLVIKSQQENGKIKIYFIDDGPGIAKENLHKIFDPFFSTKAPGEGTGLGLSLSYGIIKEHGGEITLQSVFGRGSTFTIELPIIGYPEKKEVETFPSVSLKKLEGARILIAEDEQVLGELIRRLLKGEGYKVELANDGYKALELVKDNNYDVIISDIKMPRLSGKEFYKKLKKKKPQLTNRIIFLTGDVLDENTNKFLKQFKGKYLIKPFVNEHLLALISEVIGESQEK